ncbi:MAG: 23S rRNA (adenine(2503)-C(2))-methyltransferase RlmN [Dysgonamonadaceae bacterium]|jgi:23S rRNA (adenine2503-C2)-methyltransferase|nr:23S rRNA (adenine(2503)-C(2))-methyltransferase RlmN [Dysgonamonadaceae bacterium]
MMQTILGKTLEELKQITSDLGMPAFTAKQISDWLYKKKITGIDNMSNLSVQNREKLKEKFTIGLQSPIQKQESKDGTVKYLFNTATGHFIETVYIPDDERATLCVSSQVGCKMNCLFCMTGKQGFSGNLSANEIMNQIQSIPENSGLTNIVFMGMGEPMDNIDEIFKTLEILTSDYGYAWSPKRITVSTIGVIPGLKRFIEESQCHLAISIHSPYKEERKNLMPVEKAYPIDRILDLIRKYDFSHQRRISFEYIMFKGLNDDLQHAKDLAKLLAGIPCRVNLIKYHAIPDVDLKSSDMTAMPAFRDYLSSKGITCTIRSSRGEDILAACGMLSTKECSIFAGKL